MRRTHVSTLGLLALLAACGGGSDLLLPGVNEPATIVLVQGDMQNGRVGQPVPQALVAVVSDGTGRPVRGATVVFSLTNPAPGALISPDTALSDADGRAMAQVVLGTSPGAQNGQVEALGGNGSPAATVGFTLTALSENANGITAVDGLDQSAPVGATLPVPLVVLVADAFGNPIAGVEVSWTVEGGGSVSASTTRTGEDGRTSVERTLGSTAGTQRTLATVEGLAGSPVAFIHTATAGTASGVSIVAGDAQTGSVSTELPVELVVEVRDAQSNPVPGIAVTWVIGAGGGSITPPTTTTDESGRASAAWTLGSQQGSNTVSAVVSGIGVAAFSATATGGAPARLTVRTQPSASAVSGVALATQPVIQLLDAQGNESRQSGVRVTVAIGTGGGTLSGATTVATDADGRAAFSGLAIVGSPGTRTLRFSADNFARVTSQPVELVAASTTTAITSDTPDPSVANENVTVAFTVTSSAGTPGGSVTVSDGTDSCTGPLANGQGTCTVTLRTEGSRTLTAQFVGNGGFAGSSATESHTVQPAPMPELQIARQPSATATSGVAFAQQPAIQANNADGGPLTQAGIPVSATLTGGGGTLTGTTTVSTDDQGLATFTDLAINGPPGTYTITFTSANSTQATSSPITVEASPDPGQSFVTVSPETVPSGTPTTVTVTVHAADGSPLGGRQVRVTATGSDNQFNPADGGATTGADGTATVMLTSGTIETKTISATSDGVTLGDAQLTVAPTP